MRPLFGRAQSSSEELELGEVRDLIRSAQKEVLDSYRKEFDQLSASFRDLDSKAQGTAGIAGIFLAASLTYLNRLNGLDTKWKQVLMIVAVTGLICSIAFCLYALRIRRIAGQPSGEDLEELLAALVNTNDEEVLEARLGYFYGDAARLWRKIVTERRLINDQKALQIWSAQRSLMVTAISIALLIFSAVSGG
jgi:hypothetical protein